MRRTFIPRIALGAVLFTALVAMTLSAPARVAACQCMGSSYGDIVFTGTVIESPNELSLLHDVFLAKAGVYTFEVQSLERGDAFDGRVYSGGATCEDAYQVGATYRVHARHVTEDNDWGSPPDVSVAIGPCMVHPELVAPRSPLTALPHWALSSEGVPVLLVVGFGLVVGTGTYLSRRRRSSAGAQGSARP